MLIIKTMDTFSVKIRAWREMTKLSQKEFAGRADVHVNTVMRVESGKNVTIFQLSKIAKAIGMTLAELVA